MGLGLGNLHQSGIWYAHMTLVENQGSMEARKHRSTKSRNHGSTEARKHGRGTREARKHRSGTILEAQRSMEAQMHESTEALKHGSTEAPKHGSTEARMEGVIAIRHRYFKNLTIANHSFFINRWLQSGFPCRGNLLPCINKVMFVL